MLIAFFGGFLYFMEGRGLLDLYLKGVIYTLNFKNI